jgi:serine/threonine protein phosphatase 1
LISWNPLQALHTRHTPSVPNGFRIYAIGDVHGRADLLQRLVDRIRSHVTASPKSRPILVFLGDYIDRGPASREVIRQLLSLREHWEVIFLKGNHESYLLEFLDNPTKLPEWIHYGGLYTLRSYGLQLKDYLNRIEQELIAMSLLEVLYKARHLDFLRKLKTSYICGDFFFAHAGIRPGIPLDQQSEADLLYIRNDFLLHKKDLGKIVVHGHTPVSQPDIRSNRINIDTGAFVTGQLTCLVIERNEINFI